MASEVMAMEPEFMTSGLVNYRPYARRYEGPYSRLCKLVTLNRLGAHHTCRILFGKGLLTTHARAFHGRSLLGGAFINERGEMHELARSVASQALDTMCGPWAQWIASDARVRCCPECISVGFQSVVHQIVGITRCPAHGSVLFDVCPDCGHPLPSYALTRETLDTPMCCTKCCSALSKASQAGALRDCREAVLDERPFALVHSWLRRLGTVSIEWCELSAWHPVLSMHCAPTDMRRAVFSALTGVLPFPLPLDGGDLVRVVARGPSPLRTNGLPVSLQQPFLAERIAIYKSIRRQVQRRLRLDTTSAFGTAVDLKEFDWKTFAPLPGTPKELSSVHAWFLWRNRFECNYHPGQDGFQTEQHAPSSVAASVLRLRHEVLSWPSGWSSGPTQWGHFVWQCFLADWTSARGWSEAIASVAHTDWRAGGFRSDEARFKELYATWAPLLNPEIRSWPRTLSQFAWTASGRDEKELVLVGAGMQHRGVMP